MRFWRAAIAAATVGLIGIPLALPLAELALAPAAWGVYRDVGRFLVLSQNTLVLVVGVLCSALPIGSLLAILLFRSDLPGRTVLRRLLVVSMFVPLPFLATSWQTALGGGSWFSPSGAGQSDAYWRPWLQGQGMAIWVHAVAGLPWVIWLVGLGLRHVEAEVEETALLSAGPWSVCLTVTLPRAGAAVGAAALWLAVQSATDITVTDITVVRTFAEEVYTQFVSPDTAAELTAQIVLSRAVAAAVPVIVIMAGVLCVAARQWQRHAPPLTVGPEPRVLIRWGHYRAIVTVLAFALMLTLLIVPVASLGAKLGAVGANGAWSLATARTYLHNVALAHGRSIVEGLAWAFAVGLATSILALGLCWSARRSRWFGALLLVVVAVAWAMPGPVVGIGLKVTIERLMDFEQQTTGTSLAWQFLYDGPSMLPVAWAWLVRLLPFAVAFVWPTVRLIPDELFETARLDGARPTREFVDVIWPSARLATLGATVVVTALALGELSASKLVATAGAPSFAHEIFALMHYGTGNLLAGMCLLLLAICLLPIGLFTVLPKLARRG